MYSYEYLLLRVSKSHQRATSDPEEVTNEALRTMCDSTLHLLTTTVGRLADVNVLISLSDVYMDNEC